MVVLVELILIQREEVKRLLKNAAAFPPVMLDRNAIKGVAPTLSMAVSSGTRIRTIRRQFANFEILCRSLNQCRKELHIVGVLIADLTAVMTLVFTPHIM